MKTINRIATLITISTVLTISLFGFVVVNYDNLNYKADKEKLSIGCGTSHLQGYKEIGQSPMVKKGQALFESNCKSCHRINSVYVGPALSGIFERRDSTWIRKMTINAHKLIKSGNKEARKLFKEYNGTAHPNFEFLAKEDIDSLLEYLKVAE